MLSSISVYQLTIAFCGFLRVSMRSLMIELNTYLAYIAACAAIVIVPGPTVTLIFANSLRSGTSAGLMNVAGTQVGLLIMLGVLAAGLTTIVHHMAAVFDIVRLVGAVYLVWLGIKLWRSDGALGAEAKLNSPETSWEYFWQGFLVVLSNPKVLLFFGAFIPQFIDPTRNALMQTVVLGATFMVVATLLDGAYAFAAGRTGSLLSRHNIRILERVSGTALIGGGIWLALTRR